MEIAKNPLSERSMNNEREEKVARIVQKRTESLVSRSSQESRKKPQVGHQI
jgi:hypothetical protein